MINHKAKLYMARIAMTVMLVAFCYASWYNPDDARKSQKQVGTTEGNNAIVAQSKVKNDAKQKTTDITKDSAATSKSVRQGQLVASQNTITHKQKHSIKKKTKKNPNIAEASTKSGTNPKNKETKNDVSMVTFSGLGQNLKNRIQCASIELDFEGSTTEAMKKLGAILFEDINTIDSDRYLVDLNGKKRYFGGMLMSDNNEPIRLILPGYIQNEIFDQIAQKTINQLNNDKMAVVTKAKVSFNSNGNINNVEVKTI
jgi:hypothetical protein